MRKIYELLYYYVDEEIGAVCLDAYFDDNENSDDNKIIAYFFIDNHQVIYVDYEYMTHPFVVEAIETLKKEYPIRDTLLTDKQIERLIGAFRAEIEYQNTFCIEDVENILKTIKK